MLAELAILGYTHLKTFAGLILNVIQSYPLLWVISVLSSKTNFHLKSEQVDRL